MNIDKEKVEKSVKMFLEAIGEDPNREGLLETPKRVAKMTDELFRGYGEAEDNIVKTFNFNGKENQIIVEKDIPFYSVCEHHILPFFGKISVAYIPNKKIFGLSKIPRICDYLSRKLQLQENLTKEIVDYIEKEISPKGVYVTISAKHMCIAMRGIQAREAITKTSLHTGLFDKYEIRKEADNLLK
ncbi:MAG: GTP cyclohydrolase I FolE [Peptoniphilaceae bacterium]|nr:GTP cyclohydrolase I FolE [Peptoniphilaceae bacterium]MDD7382976.1 GTP cyclohydrolase I FolE [Peptoniphilaceae bacterium]MDY3737727.1 GTP cyclohydrolase I FolE [Peptoniphilaceae bacterium]